MLLPSLSCLPAHVLAWALAQAALLLGAVAVALARLSGSLAAARACPADGRVQSSAGAQPADCSVRADAAGGSAAWPSTACFGEEPCTGSAAVKQEQDSGRGTARAKAAFLQQAGDDYGYGGAIDSLRRDSLARLRGRVYVDHAGAALYCEDQLRAAVLVRCETMTRALDSGCLQARAPLCCTWFPAKRAGLQHSTELPSHCNVQAAKAHRQAPRSLGRRGCYSTVVHRFSASLCA